MAKVNFTEDDMARSRTVESAGWHLTEVIKHEEGAAKTDNSKLFKWQLKVLDGEYKGMIVYYQLSEKAMGMGTNFAKACGAKVDPKKGLSGWDTESPVGKRIEAYIKPDVYNGKPKNDVADFRPVGAGRSAS